MPVAYAEFGPRFFSPGGGVPMCDSAKQVKSISNNPKSLLRSTEEKREGAFQFTITAGAAVL
jgi:hypothetical protein